MKNIFIVILGFLAAFIFIVSDKHSTVVYDCRDAHWLPDVPPEVKTECSKMRKDDWERLQQDGKKKLLIHT